MLQINGLGGSVSASAADAPFYLRSGYMNAAGTYFQYAGVSGAGVLHAQVTSSTGSVGQLRTAAATGAAVTVDFQPGQNDTPYSVAAGGIAFDPIATGTTTVSATAIGFTTYSGSSQVVTVNPWGANGGFPGVGPAGLTPFFFVRSFRWTAHSCQSMRHLRSRLRSTRCPVAMDKSRGESCAQCPST